MNDRIAALYQAGVSLRAIAAEVSRGGRPISHMTIKRILRDLKARENGVFC